MSVFGIIQLSISWLLIVAILLPFVRHDFWVFRILEYPRFQKFLLCLPVVASFIYHHQFTNLFVLLTFLLLSLGTIYLGYKVWPYTPFAAKEMKGLKGANRQNQVKILGANVYQDNDLYDKMLAQIKQCDPDIIMLLETDKIWEQKMDVLMKDYRYTLKEPIDNTYGMLFYSRFEITEGSIKYLVENDVPSLEATLKLPGGQLVKTFGLHPKPPVPGEDDRSTAKDKEIMKVAFKVRDEQLPVIVMGDLNDVAWSHVTELFRKTSGLLDPRRGRGFYSTFSANHWFLRFPLDYVFCSAHFGLIKMKRLPHNGSDHFAMFSQFEYHPILETVQEQPKADAQEIAEAKEKATQKV